MTKDQRQRKEIMGTNALLTQEAVLHTAKRLDVHDIGRATIRELVSLVGQLEKENQVRFVRMEMGIPGLEPEAVGTEAEIAALKRGVASKYVVLEGLPELKTEISRFAKLFLDISVRPGCCIPSVGSMQGSYAVFMVAGRRDEKKDTTLFVDPCFPVHKQQMAVQGLKYESFDAYEYRGEKLRSKIESYLSIGNISSIMYSNPNNPAWICFDERELSIIAQLADQYGALIIEDMAYFGMDFRTDYSAPGRPPYQPTIARYTDNYVLLISASKTFSYAGQRIGMILVSDALYDARFPDLTRFYSSAGFGHSLVYGSLYALTSGTAHSAQFALQAILKAVNDGEINLTEKIKVYRDRARTMKRILTNNGFNIVYDRDGDVLLSDGFYFTFSYPGFSGGELVEALLGYGISAISLEITGSSRLEGLRACVSLIDDDQMKAFEDRIVRFRKDHTQ